MKTAAWFVAMPFIATWWIAVLAFWILSGLFGLLYVALYNVGIYARNGFHRFLYVTSRSTLPRVMVLMALILATFTLFTFVVIQTAEVMR